MEFCSHVWWVWRAAPWPDVDLRPHLPITLMTYKKEIIMETLLIVIMLFIVLDIASLHWGFDSTDRINSLEWKHRQERGGIF
jgi:hypothetical protein